MGNLLRGRRAIVSPSGLISLGEVQVNQFGSTASGLSFLSLFLVIEADWSPGSTPGNCTD